MTKKIQCKIIDSTPLTPDDNMHLGWDFSSSIYSSSEDKCNSTEVTKTTSNETNQTGGIIDCYA